jgi:hypothetical protein
MESQEAADLIHAISSSLRANPSQFQINVSMSGFCAQNTAGVGYLAQNTGGVGFSSNIGNPSVQIAHQQAGGTIDAQMAILLSKLDAIEAHLSQPIPEKSELIALADAVYAEKWVPGVITAFMAALLKGL